MTLRNRASGCEPLVPVWFLAALSLCILFSSPDVQSADCNGNERLDTEDIAGGLSEDCNENRVPDECERVPVAFRPADDLLPVPPNVHDIKTGDFNGDELADIVALSLTLSESFLTVFLSDGSRNYAAGIESPALDRALAFALADFDGDGNLDVVTANHAFVQVFAGNGDGTLAEPVRYDEARQARFVTVGDLNGDASPDLITMRVRQTSVAVRLNRGDGTFGARLIVPVGSEAFTVASGDFDGDGNDDLAVADVNDFVVLLSQGDGTFSEPGRFPIGDRRPTEIESHDLNGDGILDLVAVRPAPNFISVAIGRGDGTFDAPVVYRQNMNGFVVSDLNGDGDLDLALTESYVGLSIGLNDGAGRFHLGLSSTVFSNSLRLMTAADLDGDGKNDLVMADLEHAVGLYWNGGSQTDVVFERETIPLFGCERPSLGCKPHSVALGDLDGDGDLDVLGCSTHPGSFSVLLNDGVGRMEAQSAYTFGNENPQGVVLADVDHDGDLDALTCDHMSHDFWVHRNRGDATFEPPIKTPVGRGPIHLQLADFDDDGNLDAVTADQHSNTVSVGLGEADGSFPRFKLYAAGAGPRAVAVADLDGDDDEDLAVAAVNLSILRGRGDGTFEGAESIALGAAPNHVVAADLDGDGDQDLITANTGARTSSVLLNRGDGTFSSAGEYPSLGSPYSVTAVDVDLDGTLDLVTGSQDQSSVSFLIGVPGGGENGLFDLPYVVPSGHGLRFVLAVDLDLDGDPDLVTNDRQGKSVTFLYNTVGDGLGPGSYLERICTPADFQGISAHAGTATATQRFVKFTLSVGDTPLPPVAFQNTKRFRLHTDFLAEEFEDQFAGLSPQLYNALVGVRVTRKYFVGSISRFASPKGYVYGFSVFARWNDPVERLSAAETKEIYDGLKAAFELEPFAYAPADRAAIDVANEWRDPGFPIDFDSFTPVEGREAYTVATGYGRVRVLTPEQFEVANTSGEFSFQDILVLARAPRDIEGVVGGVVTAEPQGPLSHVAVRTNRRGTPNMFLSDALEVFAPFETKIVRLEVSCADYTVEEASLEEAQAVWESQRPTLSVLPAVDREYDLLPTLTEIAAMEQPGGPSIETRFGGKAAGLARLETILTGAWSEYGERGFAIPVQYYLQFMSSNEIPSALDFSRVSYEAYLAELFSDPGFFSDSRFRFAALERLREHMEDEGQVDPALVEQLAARIVEVFDVPTSRVRFRSSSNVEDAIEFNGAGLYDSTSVCAADDLDGDTTGPSQCQAFKDNERGVARGLKRVWASLWNYGAYEERAFYSIPQEHLGMGILVNRAFVDESVNGVAFTGNPTNRFDRRYVVTAQVGEESVVSPDPGVLPETSLLEIQDGEVAQIIRAVPSTLVPLGTHVLSDAQLEEFGALLSHIDENYPLDTGEHSRSDVLLDLEFKIENTGELAVKQVRPFLLTDQGPPPPTFELVIPPHTAACGMFSMGRGARGEYELKSTVRFRAGSVSLPTDEDTFTGDVIEELVIGTERRVATPLGPGVFRVIRDAANECEFNYSFEYEQRFLFPGDEETEIALKLSQLEYRPGEVGRPRVLDSEALTDGVFLFIGFEQEGAFIDIVYSACGHATLPLWEVNAELSDGTSLVLEERYREELHKDFGPASLVYGQVDASGARRHVRDYFELVYSAVRHNKHVVYWVELDPPLEIEGVGQPVGFVELRAPEETENIPPGASYLGEDFERLATVDVVRFTKEISESSSPRFIRGDARGDGRLNLSDAVTVLLHLFRGQSLWCRDAADVDDDGAIEIDDVLGILEYLFFLGQAPQPPFPMPGRDPSEDDLGCEG